MQGSPFWVVREVFGLVMGRDEEEPRFRTVEGVKFRTVYLRSGASLSARLSRWAAARTLAGENIREAVFLTTEPRERGAFERRGIAPIACAPLYRATAEAIVRRVMTQRGLVAGRATIAFAAEELTPEFRRMVERLCGEVRYVLLRVPGAEELARKLQQRYGVAARPWQSSAAPRADLCVVFGSAEAGGEALRVGENLNVVYESEHPNALLSALLRAGALAPEALAVRSVRPFGGETEKETEKTCKTGEGSL